MGLKGPCGKLAGPYHGATRTHTSGLGRDACAVVIPSPGLRSGASRKGELAVSHVGILLKETSWIKARMICTIRVLVALELVVLVSLSVTYPIGFWRA